METLEIMILHTIEDLTHFLFKVDDIIIMQEMFNEGATVMQNPKQTKLSEFDFCYCSLRAYSTPPPKKKRN